jgi:hypothetical protein
VKACRTPVVVFAFNRPEKIRRLLNVLRLVQPSTLLLAVDGPRPDYPTDVNRCQEVRRLLQGIDWPCEIIRDYSETNQGCDRRIPAGIDWAFEHVDEAILLEDDLLPHPSFFAWCAEMLDRYRGSDEVLCISGRNNMGRWGKVDDDHHLIYRGSNWGFGTWQQSWLRTRAVPLPGAADVISGLLAERGIDPWVARHFEMLRGLSSRVGLRGWDTRWELQRSLLGGLSAVPPVNLIANSGFDSEATHTRHSDSLVGLQPVGCAPRPSGRIKYTPDHQLDRWSLLIELLDACRDPRIFSRLARCPTLVTDERVRYHLGPFASPTESLGALRHLGKLGVHSERLDTFIKTLEEQGKRSGGVDDRP